jgi:phage terminase large subunit-like protein
MIDSKTYQRYAADPAAFRNDLIVDVDGVARRFGTVMDPWQRDDFAALEPALLRCAGQSDADARMRAYLERPRGHSKTTDLAVTCVWALAFATRPLRGYCFAADKDQATLLKDAMATIVRLNPWLASILDVQKNLVVNIAAGHPGEGGKLDIFTSDVASSWGILPDLIIADELCHWEGDGSLWHSIISSAAKRSNCLLCVISNAGFVDSWQWAVREAARTDEAWIFSRLDGAQASWLSPERLAELRRMLPAIAAARLIDNLWSASGGDALTPADIQAAFMDGLQPMTGKESGWLFVGGVDLGLTRDCSAVVVLGVPAGGRAGRIRLAHQKLWRPTPGKKINLLEVEKHILDLDEQYGLEAVGFDPWQCEHLAQTLEADAGHRRRNQRRRYGNLPWMREIPPTGANLRDQATLIIESFVDRRLQLYSCDPLKHDLLKLRCEEKSYGMRLTSPRDGTGHGDTFSAFSLALLVGHEFAGKKKIVAGVLANYTVDTDSVSGTPGVTQFVREKDAYEKRMQELAKGGYDYAGMEGWDAIMRYCGRK